jgi:hypothetical protein
MRIIKCGNITSSYLRTRPSSVANRLIISSNQLLKIVNKGHAHVVETYDFLVPTLCRINIYALLSAPFTASQEMGIFAEDKIVPIPHKHKELLLLAVRVAQLGRDLRSEMRKRKSQSKDSLGKYPYTLTTDCQDRVRALQRDLETRAEYYESSSGRQSSLKMLASVQDVRSLSLCH